MASRGDQRPSDRKGVCWSGASLGERGAATVLVVATIGVVLAVLVAGLALTSAVVATHQARSAADLGALATAQALERGADPFTACAAGASVVRANGARPSGCVVGLDGSVTCRATTSPSFILPGTPRSTTTATARAGPSP